ncbi:MAG: transketolase-like TK C-terminal-containing protein, partial [Acidimicrobiales bacterium]
GEPLGEEEVVLTKKALGWEWPNHTFYVPAEVRERMDATHRGREARTAWEERFAAWAERHPDLAEEWRLAWSGALPEGWDADLPSWKPGEKEATRAAAGKALNALAAKVPWLIGGDADLAGSTKTTLKGEADFNGQTGAGRNFHYGVREHGMGSITNGMAYHGGVRPFCATFFVFSDYMRPAVRLAAMSGYKDIFSFTHDSVGLGEDGPTHQPVEHLASLRAMPGMRLIRPADANETAAAWRVAIDSRGPTALVLTRQNVPVLDGTDGAPVERGAYVLVDPGGDGEPDLVLIGTGSEVGVCVEAATKLADAGLRTRVVSMPSWDLFAAQPDAYQDSVLPPEVPTLAVEAGASLGWDRWADDSVSLDRFGASAPGAVALANLGFTPDNVAARARQLVDDLREEA